MPVKPDRAPLADRAAAGGLALLVVDMVSSWDFPDAGALAPAALAIAPRIGALERRCRSVGVPVVFVNDNRGRWRSEFRELVRASIAENTTGAGSPSSCSPATTTIRCSSPSTPRSTRRRSTCCFATFASSASSSPASRATSASS